MSVVDDEDEDNEVEPRRAHWAAVLGVGFTLIGNLGRVVTALGDDLSTMWVMHANHVVEQKAAYERTQHEIESLPETADRP